MLSRTFAILAAVLIVAGPAVAGTAGGGSGSGSGGGHGGGGGGGGGHAGIGGHAGGGHIGGGVAGHAGGMNGRSAGIGPATRGAAHAVAMHADAKHPKPQPRLTADYIDQFRMRYYRDLAVFPVCTPIDLNWVDGRTGCGGATKAPVDRSTGLPIR